MTNILFILSTLSLCTLMTTDSFGCQKKASLKRKRFDQDQRRKPERVFTLFPQLPNELQRYVIGKADFNSLDNLQATSKNTRSDVQSVSQFYIHDAQEHKEKMLSFKSELHESGVDSKIKKIVLRDVDKKLITANYNIEMAQHDHSCDEFALAISYSRSALAIPISKMPQDKMQIEYI